MKHRIWFLAAITAAMALGVPAAVQAMPITGPSGPTAYTTSTALTTVTEDPSNCTATPNAVPVQTGVVVGIPCTYPISTTTVTTTTLHTPTAQYGARPIIGYGPRPIVGYGPRPIVGYGSPPIIGYGAKPIIGHGPRPIVGYGSPPIIGYGAKPITGHGPRPIIGYGPKPIIGYRTVQTGPLHRTVYETKTVKVAHPHRKWTAFSVGAGNGNCHSNWGCTRYGWSTYYTYTYETVQVPVEVTFYLTSQVPVYGAAPPIYGPAPPIYGKAPPIYGKAPAIYGAAPPIYGAAPPIYGPAPPIYGAAPPIYGSAPPVYGAATIIGYNWSTSPAGTSTQTSTSYQSGLLFATPLGGGGGSTITSPGHNGPWYVIPIDTSGN